MKNALTIKDALMMKEAMKNQLKKKNKGNVKDQWVDFKYWLKTWSVSMSMPMPNPIKIGNAMFEYPWMLELTKTVAMIKKFTEGRNGTALKMTWMAWNLYVQNVVRMIQDVLIDPDNTIMAQIMIPTEIYQAMGLKWYTVELPANCMAMVDQHSLYKYLDLVQNNGLPDDTCSYTSQVPGVVFAGHSPRANTCLIGSNLPCESGASNYGIVQEVLGLPTYRLDVPYNFHEEAAIKTYVEDMKGLISFLEEHTGHKMDWDRLKTACERQNQLYEIELERWEMNRSPVPPVHGDVMWLSHLQWLSNEAGSDYGLDLFQKFQKMGRKAYYFKEPAVNNMRYRVVMWSPPTFCYAHFWNWLERCWGICVVNDMETFSTGRFIDTTSPDTMLEGLALQWCNAAMARHSRGPAENWLNDLNRTNEMYQPDFILNFNHIGCRSTMGLTGIFKEWSREKNQPVCFVDYNMYDTRVVSRQEQRDQVNNFMLNVMKATPLDESLLVIDDDNDW